MLVNQLESENMWMRELLSYHFKNIDKLKMLSDLLESHKNVDGILNDLSNIKLKAYSKGFDQGLSDSKFKTSEIKIEEEPVKDVESERSEDALDIESILSDKIRLKTQYENDNPITADRLWLSKLLQIDPRVSKSKWNKTKKSFMFKIHPDLQKGILFEELTKEMNLSYDLLVKSGNIK
ncbi:MAG: hypothetical protein ACRCU6_12110 [Fusobacteriaceae bacterium]